jgi:hypothetical protein
VGVDRSPAWADPAVAGGRRQPRDDDRDPARCHEDGAFTLAAYLTSEQAARAGEQQVPPPEAAGLLREEMDLMQDVVYLDLREPWLFSPGT